MSQLMFLVRAIFFYVTRKLLKPVKLFEVVLYADRKVVVSDGRSDNGLNRIRMYTRNREEQPCSHC